MTIPLKSSASISLVSLVLLITGAIDSIRNLPATALFGSSLIFFFIVSSIIFLIPVAFVAAELASTWSDEEGGIYFWVKQAFGEQWAFMTIWLQWINTIVWYPSMISFIAGTAAYFFDPSWATHKMYIITVIIVVFWTMTLINLRGVSTSARFAAICAVLGMLIPMALIIILGIIWICKGNPIHVSFSVNTLIPHWKDNASWISLTAIMTSFLGMELAAVHVKQVKNPQRNFPRAILYSVLLILSTIIFGSLAIAFVLPSQDISLVSGVMQAFNNFFAVYHLQYMTPIITALLLLGSLGGMTNWIIAPVKGLLMAAEGGYMPPILARRNARGVPVNLLLLQAILVTCFCGAFVLIPSVNGIYWLLTALSTQLYMLMYVMMFLAALKIRNKKKHKKNAKTFSIPGGRAGFFVTCILGLLGCFITLIVGFIPPEILDIGSVLRYELTFCIGFVGLLIPSVLFYYYRKRRKI